MRLRVPDLDRRRRTVNTIMLFRQIDPNDANRIPRPRLDGRLLIRRVRVPEETRVVMKRRVMSYSVDLPGPNRKRIVFAANGRYVIGQNLTPAIQSRD